MLHQILKSFIDLGAKLDLPFALENTPLWKVQCEPAEFIT
jgi:hypothetical protein